MTRTSSFSDELTSDGFSPGGFGPDSPSGERPWYKRWPLWTAVIVAVIAASVVSDLPQRSTVRDQTTVAAAVLSEINTDMHPCAFATTQAFSIYSGAVKGTFTASDRSLIPGYLSDDLKACSFGDQSIFSLSTITVPTSPAGRDLGSIIKTELEWSTSDSVWAIQDIETLVDKPHDRSLLGDLSLRAHRLASDRALAEQQRHEAEDALDHAKLPALNLPKLPTHPLGT